MLLIGFSENTLSRESAGMTTATNERSRMALLAQSFTAVASNEFCLYPWGVDHHM